RPRAAGRVGAAAPAPAVHDRARVHAPAPGARARAARRAAVRPVGARALAAARRFATELPEAAEGAQARPAHERPGARAVRGGAACDRRARGRRPALPRELRGLARRSVQPAPGRDAVVKRIRVAAAVVWDGPRLLMTQRAPGGALGLQWEFP